MKNKKLLIAGASAASLAALGLGAFAFFVDTAEINKNTKVGTVDISATAEIKHTQLKREVVLNYPYIWSNFELPIHPNWVPYVEAPTAEGADLLTKEIAVNMFENAPDNLNPGDNMLNDQDAYPGTDHEIILNITNEGSKSVVNRILFEITGTDAEGNALTAEELSHINIFADNLNTISGLTSAPSPRYMPEDIFSERENVWDDYLSEDNKYILEYEPTNSYSYSASETDFGKVFVNEGISLGALTGVLSGNSEKHDNAEIEKIPFIKLIDAEDEEGYYYNDELEIINVPHTATMKFDIGMDSVNDFKNYNGTIEQEDLETLAKLQNADIKIKVIVQAMQFRNVDIDAWDVVFYQEFEV